MYCLLAYSKQVENRVFCFHGVVVGSVLIVWHDRKVCMLVDLDHVTTYSPVPCIKKSS